uniref:Uncharacterized protein n=1 Tax=Arundo donax TaxID=35708 RepID=A0A0A9G0A7_ARUDO
MFPLLFKVSSVVKCHCCRVTADLFHFELIRDCRNL